MSKRELMDKLVFETSVCRKCHLWEQSNRPVPGDGSLDASLMFIGEAPGYWEDVKGRPFVGAAGKILDELLSGIDLKRGDVYIGNIIKHRPPMNRPPRKGEVEACAPYLDRQIRKDCANTVNRMRQALEAVEWIPQDRHNPGPSECPWCYGVDSHNENCQRQAALRATEGGEEGESDEKES